MDMREVGSIMLRRPPARGVRLAWTPHPPRNLDRDLGQPPLSSQPLSVGPDIVQKRNRHRNATDTHLAGKRFVRRDEGTLILFRERQIEAVVCGMSEDQCQTCCWFDQAGFRE